MLSIHSAETIEKGRQFPQSPYTTITLTPAGLKGIKFSLVLTIKRDYVFGSMMYGITFRPFISIKIIIVDQFLYAPLKHCIDSEMNGNNVYHEPISINSMFNLVCVKCTTCIYCN